MTTPGPVRARRRRLPVAVLLCAASAAACGQKGPPLAPLRLVPGPVTELTARRAADEVRLQFTLPASNLNGPGPIDLDHVEVYAVTVAPGRVTPPNRDLLTETYAVGRLPVRPPAAERTTNDGEAAPAAADPAAADAAPDETRPGPGERAVFTEPLTEAVRTPAPLPVATPEPGADLPAGAAAPGDPASATAPADPVAGQAPSPPPRVQPGDANPPPVPAGPPVSQTVRDPSVPDMPVPTPPEVLPGAPATTPSVPVAAPPAPAAVPPAPPVPYPVRIYVVRGISRAGRPGQPSQRVTVPLVDPPPPPDRPTGEFTEQAVVLTWPALEPAAEGPPVTYHVYRADVGSPAVTPSPVAEPRVEVAEFQVGREDCFVVRSVQTYAGVPVESAASAEGCVTPLDIFPPSAPPRLSGFFLEGAIELVWDVSPEPDVAGYIILRGSAPGDTLQPLTPEPVAGTTFRDTTVTPGTSYAYAVVAVDRAGNRSPPSSPAEGTAR